MEFPALVYRDGGPHQRPGGTFDHRLVLDDDQLQAALADGWHRTVPEAIEAGRKPAPAPTPASEPVTVEALDAGFDVRASLEAEATALGIDFDGRTSDRKLAARIAAVKG